RLVQRNAMATCEGLGKPGARSVRDHLERAPEVAGEVFPEALARAMDPAPHVRAVDAVSARVSGTA
ncbi:MAG: adenylosuccinate lyase, partial [Acetobacteraceae bacterium]|nr:adenylosuccinate lyase [Acetobacteraceae bacterium]